MRERVLRLRVEARLLALAHSNAECASDHVSQSEVGEDAREELGLGGAVGQQCRTLCVVPHHQTDHKKSCGLQ